MVEFSHEYFEDEVRDGFYVNGLMKKCWAAQIEVLSDIASVCAKYNIKWYADCGTLLGAVRHGGFIPWDDDLDKRYEELMALMASEELYNDAKRFDECMTEYTALSKKIPLLEAEWLELSEQLENAQ